MDYRTDGRSKVRAGRHRRRAQVCKACVCMAHASVHIMCNHVCSSVIMMAKDAERLHTVEALRRPGRRLPWNNSVQESYLTTEATGRTPASPRAIPEGSTCVPSTKSVRRCAKRACVWHTRVCTSCNHVCPSVIMMAKGAERLHPPRATNVALATEERANMEHKHARASWVGGWDNGDRHAFAAAPDC